jgi:serine/threonine-protein kinase
VSDQAEQLDRLKAALADRYRIERELGRGGMATVYLAEDLKHHRPVAVKVLRPELAAAIGPERFLREIKLTARLDHPHILPLHDSGEAGGFLYYVMPYVEGGSLRDRLNREKQLPIDDAIQLTREVAGALDFAHQQNIVHRDIKPENILLAAGHARVADFGIARAIDTAGGDRLTETGLAIGTAGYMAPEQAAGESDLDGRSDIYALGCVLYEMLSGQPPFIGATRAAVVRQHIVTDPAPITNLRASVPPQVAGALARSLAKNPADRFSSAGQLVGALRLPSKSVAAASASWGGSWLKVALGGVAGVVLLGGGWFASRALGGGELETQVTRLPRSAAAMERIAVLPLENATGDTLKGYFADGMTRELIGVLTAAGVRVLGHRAVAAYGGTDLSTQQIAQELGVDAVVVGSVLQAEDMVRVTMELTDPATGENLWAATVSRPAADVLTLHNEVAGEIVRGMQAELTPEQQEGLERVAPVVPEAYAQYLLGQEQAIRWTEDGFRRSVAHFERAIALDSSFAAAHSALAYTHCFALFFGWASAREVRAVVEREAPRALVLDSRTAEARTALGWVRFVADWEFEAAEREFQRGLEISRSVGTLVLYGWFLWLTGRNDEALAINRNVLELEPTTAAWHGTRGWLNWTAGDTAATRAAATRAMELDPSFYEAHRLIAYLEIYAGRPDEAEAAIARADALSGGEEYPWGWEQAGRILVARGDRAGVHDLMTEMEVHPGGPYLAQHAVLHFVLGERDGAYRIMERAVERRELDALIMLMTNPELDPFRDEPRFRRIVEGLGLRPGRVVGR